MARTNGPPPKLNSAGISRVLKWHEERRRFYQNHGTLRSLATRQGIPVNRLIRLLYLHRSTDQTLSNVQRNAIARWRRAYQRFARRHLSAKQLAQELGVSRRVIFDCVKRNGVYVSLECHTSTPMPA
jgi:predicted DNA-binding ribbon-helix-helix protein